MGGKRAGRGRVTPLADAAALTAAWQDKAPGRSPHVLALDWDGTLVDLAGHPDAIVVPPSLPPLLNRLHQPPDRVVLIISGRARDDLARHLPGFAGVLLGNHGAEALGTVPPVAWRRVISEWARRVPGVWLEDKGATWCVHWRAVESAARPLLLEQVQEFLDAAEDPVYLARWGHMALDIVPRAANKGTALAAWLQRHIGADWRHQALVAALGDDATDEDLFQVVDPQGLAVQVGEREPTRAVFRLPNPAAARRWLAERAVVE